MLGGKETKSVSVGVGGWVGAGLSLNTGPFKIKQFCVGHLVLQRPERLKSHNVFHQTIRTTVFQIRKILHFILLYHLNSFLTLEDNSQLNAIQNAILPLKLFYSSD